MKRLYVGRLYNVTIEYLGSKKQYKFPQSTICLGKEGDTLKAIVRRFNRDDRASIAHALMHLETNKIADDDYPGHSGWYCGNREQFVKRHKKAVTLMRSLLTPNNKAQLRSEAE